MTGRSRASGIPAATRVRIYERDDSTCQRCAMSVEGRMFSIHHRIPRGMGGTSNPAIHDMANLLLLCGSGTTGCHGRIERRGRAEGWAWSQGWLVERGRHPGDVPILRFQRTWSWLSESWTRCGLEPRSATDLRVTPGATS